MAGITVKTSNGNEVGIAFATYVMRRDGTTKESKFDGANIEFCNFDTPVPATEEKDGYTIVYRKLPVYSIVAGELVQGVIETEMQAKDFRIYEKIFGVSNFEAKDAKRFGLICGCGSLSRAFNAEEARNDIAYPVEEHWMYKIYKAEIEQDNIRHRERMMRMKGIDPDQYKEVAGA